MPERLRSEGIVLVPAVPVIGLFVYWGAHEGGYMPTTWLPSTLVLLGLLVATVLGLGPGRLRLTRTTTIAAVALAGYAAWSYLSIIWAAAPGDALEGSSRTLLYLLAFLLFAILPWRPWTALVALSGYALGVGGLALVTLVRLVSSDDVASLFIDGRLLEPAGYVNGTAALFGTGALVGTALAARRELPVALRGVLLALATAELQASVLPQSRGWLFALPIVAVAILALLPGRLRFVLWSLPPFAGTLLALPALLDVFERTDTAGSPAVAHRALLDAAAHAGSIALPLCAAVLVLGVGLALLDRRVRPSPAVAAAADRAAATLGLVAIVAGVIAVVVATDGRPAQRLSDYLDRSGTYQPHDAGSTRFTTVGSNRPDFWRVALDAFGDRPVLGLGQDNWGDYYLRHRRSDESPRWVHSLELRLLAHTGIVGFLLFATFVGAALVAALRGRRRMPPLAAAAGAIALVPLLMWLTQGSIEWFWEIPALSAPALAFLGLSTAVVRAQPEAKPAAASAPGPKDEHAGSTRPRARGRAAVAVCCLVSTAAAVVLLSSWLAERDIATASSWHADPDGALARLAQASDLNPLDARADLTAGVVALELGRPEEARRRFGAAVARDPENAFARFGSALAASAAGDRTAARADFERARVLNPGDPLTRIAIARLDGRRPLTAAEAFRSLRATALSLTGGKQGISAP